MESNQTINKTIQGRVGSYAISTIDFDSWANEPVVQAPIKGRKPRGNKEIVHKIFAQCATVIQDPFWIDKFNNASMGKFPQKFSFHDNLLSYRKGAKCNTIEITNNPHEVAYTCMEFFRSNGGIFSPTDEKNSIELQYERTHNAQTIQPITWGEANKKVQECMLSYYITDIKDLMKLSDTELQQLRQTIRLGIGNRYFGKENIKVENNSIQSIDGLLWNDRDRVFYINPELKPNTTRVYTRKKEGNSNIDISQKDTIPQFGVKWTKYIDALEKKVDKNNKRKRRIMNNQLRELHVMSTSNTCTDVTSTVDDYDEETED